MKARETKKTIKCRKGFTLAETVIAFVLVSIVTLMVGGTLVSNYIMSVKMRDLPNSYYEQQDKVEERISRLQELIEHRTKLENERNSVPEADTASLDAEIAVVQEEIDNEQVYSSSVTLFGKEVELYKFDTEGNDSLYLYASIVNGEREIRPVPIIDSVEIKCQGSINDIYFAAGSDVTASVIYDTQNADYKWRETYQWYICSEGYHTWQERREYGDLLYGTLYASYPSSFSILAGQTGSSLIINEDMEGKFICCAVTPISKEGKMGTPVYSNYIYVSSLPEITSGNYAAVMDTSIAEISYDDSGRASSLREIGLATGSRYSDSGSAFSITAAGNRPYVDLNGSPTATQTNSIAAYSRYIRLDTGSELNIASTGTGTDVLFMVVRATPDSNRIGDISGNADFDFVTDSAGNGGGFNTYSYISKGVGSGWYILAVNADANGNISIKDGVDIAELVVVKPSEGGSVSEEDRQAIISYMSLKYGIDQE